MTVLCHTWPCVSPMLLIDATEPASESHAGLLGTQAAAPAPQFLIGRFGAGRRNLHFLTGSQVMLIPLTWDLTLRRLPFPACLGPRPVCQFSQLEPLKSHVLIPPHAGRKEYRPFIGSVRRNFTAELT